jgi:hypothetical protein
MQAFALHIRTKNTSRIIWHLGRFSMVMHQDHSISILSSGKCGPWSGLEEELD